ncbi:MAG: amino acid adenylation domain-containing protein [Candidatus Angelobacter sp.]
MPYETIEGYRLSPQQERAWRVQQEHELSGQAWLFVSIEGELDHSALRSALERTLERNEILRTHFCRLPGMSVPVQVIADAGSAFSVEENAAGEPGILPYAPLQVSDGSNGSLHSQTGPSMRVRLVSFAPKRHRLFISLPVCCSDVTGLTNLIHEIFLDYAIEAGEISAPAMQYADFAELQNQLLEDKDAHLGPQFWNTHYRAESLVEFPSLEKPAQSGFSPRRVMWEIENSTRVCLDEASVKYQLSAAQLLSSAWRCLLSRLTGTSEMVIGVTHDGRSQQELKKLLGLCAKHLPETIKIDANMSFIDLARESAAVSREASKWQEYWQSPENFHFPICFEFAEGAGEQGIGVLKIRTEEEYACFDRFDLKLVCVKQGAALRAEVHYDGSQFSEQEMSQLGKRFEILLADAVTNPELTTSELKVMDESERRQLVVEWNKTKRPYGLEKCVHELIAEQAEATPDAIAVECGDEVLSYGELNQRAEQIARMLHVRGVGPGSVVGLCVERSVEMLVGLLGILKSGGAYVCLDPRSPAERLAYLMKDCQAQFVLSQGRLQGVLPKSDIEVLLLDALEAQAPPERQAPITRAKPWDLAYVMYTSGSTGQPKGVAVEHGQLVNYVHGIQERMQIFQGARLGLISTFAADLGYTMLYPALCGGGTLVIVREEEASDPRLLKEYYTHHPVDYLKIVPAHLRALLGEGNEGLLPRHALILGGDVLTWPLVDAIREQAPTCTIINHYGPTETSVGVLTFQIPQNRQKHAGAALPLGRPLGNSEVYILDQHLEPVPQGVSGEIYVGGKGVTRGYLGRPGLTADRYLPDPFGTGPGARLYRTGDRGRMSENGEVEFLGRNDDQVKILGYRVELGEIEGVLRSHPHVREAIVVAQEKTPDNKQLVAYVTLQRNEPERGSSAKANQAAGPTLVLPNTDQLRNYLATQLPSYMVPSALIVLDRLPLTANGKVDRRALPAADEAGLRAFIAPQTSAEKVIAAIWNDVLGRESSVGTEDNFFEIGGHSLLATQVVSRLRSTFGVEGLPLVQIFQTPTVAGLIIALSESLGGDHMVNGIAEAVLEMEGLSAEEVNEIFSEVENIQGNSEAG